MWTCCTNMILICMFHFYFYYSSEEFAVQSTLRKLTEQRLQLAVFELWDKMDLQNLGEPLRESRSHKLFPAQESKKQRMQAELMRRVTGPTEHSTQAMTNRPLLNCSIAPLNRLYADICEKFRIWKPVQDEEFIAERKRCTQMCRCTRLTCSCGKPWRWLWRVLCLMVPSHETVHRHKNNKWNTWINLWE